MALFNVRLPDDLAARFDAWASGRGGRSAALRRAIREACAEASGDRDLSAAPRPRPVKLTVRLRASDAAGLDAAAAEMGLTRNAWAAALIRRRLTGRPTFCRSDEIAMIAIMGELRRIGVNVNQIAHALNTAVMEGTVLDLELAYLEELRAEVRAHMLAVRESFQGNLAYWDAGPTEDRPKDRPEARQRLLKAQSGMELAAPFAAEGSAQMPFETPGRIEPAKWKARRPRSPM